MEGRHGGSTIAKGHQSVEKLKVPNSQKKCRNTFEKPKRPNWRAKRGISQLLSDFSIAIVAK